MDQADLLTIDDIEDIVKWVSTAPVILEEDAAATLEDLHEIDEIMQEFMRVRYPRRLYAEHTPPRHEAVPPEPTTAKKLDINEALHVVTEVHAQDMKDMGTLTGEDIPELWAKWLRSCQDIMNGVPEELPPMHGVNHHIPLIVENKRYHYHLPRCPDSVKVQLMEKIMRYMRAGWWESVQTDQAAPMLCIPKKSGLLRTVIDVRKRNDNTVKDVMPFPDQDQIRLDVARAKIQLKIDFSDAYKQICTVPEDIHKSAFTTIYGTYVSHTMQIGDCNAPATFQCVMTMIFRDFIGIFLHAYLDDLFVYSNSVDEHEKHLALIFNKICKFQFYLTVWLNKHAREETKIEPNMDGVAECVVLFVFGRWNTFTAATQLFRKWLNLCQNFGLLLKFLGFRLSWGTQFMFWGFQWCLGLCWKLHQVFPSQGVHRKKLRYTMLFFVFKASESLPPPAYFGNDYQIKQDPIYPPMLHFTPAIMKSASNCLLSFVQSHPLV